MSSAPQSTRRSKLVGATVLAATLVAGALAGAAADRLLTERAALAVGHDGAPCGDRAGFGFFDALDLAPEQREQVREILERRRGQMEALWRETGPRMRALVDSTEAEIRQVLTSQQRARFDQMREERRKLLGKKRHGWALPPDSTSRGQAPAAPRGAPSR